MAAEEFFARWSRRNAEAEQAKAVAPQEQAPLAEQPEQPGQAKALPTLEDVAQLTPQSDFTPFVARGVDETIKRSALKKLFSDPHFNVMDGLDIYIDDYSKFEPIPAAMLAQLNHAKDLLDPLARLNQPLLPLLEEKLEESVQEEQPENAPQDDEQPAADDGEQDADADADINDSTEDSSPRL